jgi:hypothetical protein
MSTPGTVYFGQQNGGKVVRYGAPIDQQPYQYAMEVGVWGDQPFGNHGEGIVRWLTVIIKHTNGYNIFVAPNLDDVDLPFTRFQGPPPPAPPFPGPLIPGTVNEQIVRCTIWLGKRFNRLAWSITAPNPPGYLELLDVLYNYITIRAGP